MERGINEVNTQNENIIPSFSKCLKEKNWGVMGRNNSPSLEKAGGEGFPEKRHYSEDRRKSRNQQEGRNEQEGTRLPLGALKGWGG